MACVLKNKKVSLNNRLLLKPGASPMGDGSTGSGRARILKCARPEPVEGCECKKRSTYYFWIVFLWANFSSIFLFAANSELVVQSLVPVVQTSEPVVPKVCLGKYSATVQKHDPNLDSRLDHCDKLCEKYTNPEYLERCYKFGEKYAAPEFTDKIFNREKNRIEQQEQFNSKVFFGVNLPINENGIQINVCNRDLMLLLAVSSQWAADFIFFKMLCNSMQVSLRDVCIEQSKELLELLKKLDESIEQKNDEEIKKNAVEIDNIVGKVVRNCRIKYFQAIVLFAASTNIIYRTQNYYRLNAMFKQNLMDFMIANIVCSKSNEPIDNSLMEFLKDKSVAGLDFDLVQTTILDMATSFLCEHEILPAWVMGNKFDLARRIAFASVFVWWANKNIYKPILFSYLVSNRKNLITALEKLSINDLKQQKISEKELENILHSMPQSSFALWESNKRKHFAQWQVISNLVLLTPAFIKLGIWIYNMSKNTGNMSEKVN
ncbi:MAG: hypothetical protein WCS92_01200 [Candidatus Babeliales bacterium]